MNSGLTLLPDPSRTTNSPESTPFNVVVIYDRAESACRAMSLVDGLATEFSGDLEIHREIWRFDILEFPTLREAAFQNAAEAELLIVASDGQFDLPPTLKEFLEQWSVTAIPGSTALAAVLPQREVPSPVHPILCRYLEELATQAGQPFFARSFSPPRTQTFDPHILAAANEPLAALEKRAEPAPHWGINE